MSFPKEIDRLIRTRLSELLQEGNQALKDIGNEFERVKSHTRYVEHDRYGSFPVQESPHFKFLEEPFWAFKTKCLSLLSLLNDGSIHIAKLEEQVRNAQPSISDTQMIVGVINGIKDDYEAGMLITLTQRLEANIASDYLGQAEQLLSEGQPGKNDHIPAAVLTGAILENALRKICERQVPPISTTKASGEPKTLTPLIDDLKKGNVFNKLKADQLYAWAKIRNDAAHGNWTTFSRTDVELMLKGVKDFLAAHI